jgi:hypothetical protein
MKREKDAVCTACGFVPVHPRQLKVNPIDGDLSNDAIENLQLLCLNCEILQRTETKKPT